MRRISFVVKGLVQGVGYRYFVRSVARNLGIAGWVANHPDGSVVGEAVGSQTSIDEFVKELREGCESAVVRDIRIKDLPSEETSDKDFEIRYI